MCVKNLICKTRLPTHMTATKTEQLVFMMETTDGGFVLLSWEKYGKTFSAAHNNSWLSLSTFLEEITTIPLLGQWSSSVSDVI